MRTRWITDVRFAGGAAALSCFFFGLAFARPVRMWTFEELETASDLVVIGTVLSTRDAEDFVYEHPDATTQVVVDSIVAVSTVLKGDPGQERVTLQHRRFYDPRGENVLDAPNFVEFSPDLNHTYLMFLKKGADPDLEYYEPVTGQYDAGDSFWLLERYHIVNERAKKANPSSSADRSKEGSSESTETGEGPQSK